MKKYLLTLALSIIGFIGFSNATDYSLTSSNGTYSLDSITLTTTTDVSVGDYVCNAVSDGMNAPVCWLILSDGTNTCNIKYLVNSSSLSNGCTSLSAGTYSLSKRSGGSNFAFDSINISVLDGDTEGGLLSGGTDNFGGIITSLSSTLTEFIPYLVYVGLGILGAIIGFVAIKRLMNRIRAKIFGTFSGGRRR